MKAIKFGKLNLNKYKWVILSIFFFLLTAYLYHNKIFSLHFVDEEDNLVLGKFLLSGEKLYSDLFSHHQPLGYVLSAGLQLVTNPPNIYMLVKRHREFMIVFALVWNILLVIRFGNRLILPLAVYELTKFYLLGELFLAESLAVYPVLYITSLLFEKRPKIHKFETYITGLLIGLIGMLIAPLWPFLLGYLILLFMAKRPDIKAMGQMAFGALVWVLICLPFIDIYYYFHNVFYINFGYYIPLGGDEKQPWALIKSSYTPISAILNSTNLYQIGFVTKVVSIALLLVSVALIWSKNWRILITGFVLLTLANIRYVPPGQDYYRGFHMLIWYAELLLITIYFGFEIMMILKKKYIKYLVILSILVISGSAMFSAQSLFQKNDIEHDYYVNYSRQYTFGEAIKIMKNQQDSLFVIPDEWLLYWQGEVKHANKMVNFYPWMQRVPELNSIVVDSFKNNPPAFFYCDCSALQVIEYSKDYVQMVKDGKETSFWVLNAKMETLNEEQKRALRFHNFAI